MVTTANGQPIEGVGRCHKVSLHIQNLEQKTRYNAPPLYGMDMVLGEILIMQLGTHITNSRNNSWNSNGRGRGETLLYISWVDLKSSLLGLLLIPMMV
jgi:hypothetical protein